MRVFVVLQGTMRVPWIALIDGIVMGGVSDALDCIEFTLMD
jgi:hypothetical protein